MPPPTNSNQQENQPVKVPLLDVNAQNLPLEAELTEPFTRVLHSGRFIMGPEVEGLEQEVAEMVGAKHGIGVSSGTDAILLALMALGIGPGDEVLCPTFTFFATAGCISRSGATPVFVDACPVCFNLDVDDAARKITERTKAIIPVHLFGQSAEMDAVMKLAADHDLARGGFLEAGDDPQQGGLTAAGWADENDEFLVLNREADVMQHLGGSEGFADGEEIESCHNVLSRLNK